MATRDCARGDWLLQQWIPGSTGLITPDVPIAQSFNGITRFWRALHIKGAHVVLANKGILGLASVLGHAGHFRLLCKCWIVFVLAADALTMVW